MSSGRCEAAALQLCLLFSSVRSQHEQSFMCFCRAESQSLQRELAGLSERYSQKCLELNRAEQNNAEREREISRKERDLEQLRKENQVSYQQIFHNFNNEVWNLDQQTIVSKCMPITGHYSKLWRQNIFLCRI